MYGSEGRDSGMLMHGSECTAVTVWQQFWHANVREPFWRYGALCIAM